MRGKNILWLSVIAMLLSTMMANVGLTAPAPEPPELYMTPTGRIPGPGQIGVINDTIPIEVHISNIENLWACQFTIAFHPFVSVLSPQNFAAGPFLSEGMEGIDWMMNVVVNGLEGTVTFVIMRLPQGGWPPPPRIGESGSGMLAEFEFVVVEAGESSIDIVDSILLEAYQEVPDPYEPWLLRELEHTIGEGAFFYGTTARLIRVNLPDGRKARVGDTFPISARVKNEGDIPLYLTVRFDIRRVEDARPIELLPGQTYFGGYLGAPPPLTYLYTDGFTGTLSDWHNSPGMVGPPDGDWAWSTTAGDMSAFYTFEDITLPWEGFSVISNVDFEGYTQQDDLGNDFDPYAWTIDDEGNSYSWCWCDSMGGAPVWSWTGQRWYFGRYDFPEYYGFPRTETAVNNAEVLMYNYGASGVLMEIDSMRMRIEFATIVPVDYPIFRVEPGEEVDLDSTVWVAAEDHIGTYELTATIEYSGWAEPAFRKYNSMASPQKTLSFWIVP